MFGKGRPYCAIATLDVPAANAAAVVKILIYETASGRRAASAASGKSRLARRITVL
jgi:hypothetical protein